MGSGSRAPETIEEWEALALAQISECVKRGGEIHQLKADLAAKDARIGELVNRVEYMEGRALAAALNPHELEDLVIAAQSKALENLLDANKRRRAGSPLPYEEEKLIEEEAEKSITK